MTLEQVTDDQIAEWRHTRYPYKVIAAAIAEWALEQPRGAFLPDNDQFARNLDFVASASTWKRAKVFLRTLGVLDGDGPYKVA
jgi:hypothetical protein